MNQIMVEDLTVDPVMDKDLTVDPVMDKDLTVDPGLADSVVDPVMVEDLTVGPDMVDMVLTVNQDSVVGQGTEVPASTVVPLTVDPVSTCQDTVFLATEASDLTLGPVTADLDIADPALICQDTVCPDTEAPYSMLDQVTAGLATTTTDKAAATLQVG